MPPTELQVDEPDLTFIRVNHQTRLQFGGAVVRVPPDPRFEAWQVVGPGTRLVVCGPGGESISVWD